MLMYACSYATRTANLLRYLSLAQAQARRVEFNDIHNGSMDSGRE